MSLVLLGILNSQAAGAVAGAYDLLETTLISTNTTTLTLSGLDSYSDYKHLQLRMTIKNAQSGTGFDGIQIRFNGDTGSNYSSHYLRGYSGSVSSTAAVSTPYLQVNDCFPRAGETNIYGSVVLDILDFSSTSKNTTTRAATGAVTSTPVLTFASGAWYNTSAVTSLTLLTGERDFVSGSRISLYGSKGA